MNNDERPRKPDSVHVSRVASPSQPFSVLVVDDDPLVCETVEAVARDEGMNVSVLHGGKGLSADMLQDKQLIVLDLMMPGVDGVQVMDIVNQIKPHPPAILLISGVEGPAMESALRLGRSKGLTLDSLSKPFRAKALSVALRRQLAQRATSSPSAASSAAIPLVLSAQDMLTALAHGDIRVDLSPTVRLSTHSWHAMTAVCHWQHADLGTLELPGFRHTLIEPNVASRYFRALLPSAVHQYLTLARLSNAAARLSFPMPGALLGNEDTIEFLAETLAALGLDAGSLTLDIHHTDLGGNFDTELQAQARLQMRKVRLCVSDFDAGIADLEKLWSSAFKEVKVKASALALPHERASVTQQLRHLATEAQAHGVAVVATGVDTELIHGLIQGLGISFAQGLYLCPPMPAAELARKMQEANQSFDPQAIPGQVNRKVLFLEPNPFLQQIYGYHLRRHGFDLDLAADASEAHALTQTQNYELLIVDTAPPQGLNMAQSEAIHGLLASCTHLPTLALTDTFSHAQQAPAQSLRASSFMPRPIQLEQLLAEALRLVAQDTTIQSG